MFVLLETLKGMDRIMVLLLYNINLRNCIYIEEEYCTHKLCQNEIHNYIYIQTGTTLKSLAD